jgi:autotransporter translocation and assembly factor TamB
MRSESRTWIDGYVPFSPDTEMSLNVTTGRQPLSTFNPLLPESWFLAGYLTPDLSIGGTYPNPSLSGTVEFDSVYVQWNDRREPLQQITGIAEFNDRSFSIDELTMRYLNYPVTLGGSGNFEPSVDANITIEPRGEIDLHYSHPASDSASLSITELPLDLFQDFIPARVRSEGSLNGELQYLSTEDTLLITSNGNVNPELPGARSDWRFQWDGAYTGNTLNINRFRFGNSDENISLSGYIQHSTVLSDSAADTTTVPSPDLDLRLQIQDFQLTSLNTFYQDWNFESGAIQGALSIGGSAMLPELDGSISGSSMAWVNAFQDFRIEDGNFRWAFSGREMNIRRTAASLNSLPLTLQGKVVYGENQMIDANIKGSFAETTPLELRMQHNAEKNLFRGYAGITDLQIEDILTAAASDQQISALGDVELKIGGSRDQPQIDLDSDFREIFIGEIPFERFTLNSHYENQSIILDTLRLGRENAFIQGGAEISGRVDVRAMQVEGIGDTISLRLTSDAFPMSSLNELLPENYDLGGDANIDFTYSRDPENSSMNGRFDVTEFSSDLPYFQQQISDGHLMANFDGSVISFTDTYFIIDESTQSLAGQITLQPGSSPEYDISLQTEAVQLANPGELTLSLAPSDIRLETTAGEPAIVSGTVRVNSFKYTKPVANIQLLSLIGTRTVRPERFTEQMLQDIRLNLSLQMLQNAEVDNNLAELDFTADIQLSGPLLQPRYSGRVTSQSGEIFYLRKTFTIEEALVLFGGRPGLNPDLNITAQTIVQPHENVDNIEYTITLNVTGSLANPNVQFAAEPPARPESNETLTQSDIIGLLTIGRPRPQLATAEENSSFTQSLMRQASRYSSAQIASVLEYQVKRLLDLDRVSIEGNLFSLSGTNQPIFTAQKSLTDRLSLTYSTSIGESNMQGLRLNYRIGEHFFIVTETTQREETQYGVDLKYKIQF